MRSASRLADIARFLEHKRIALVGVSRDPKDISRALMRELRARGYQVAPVNPAAEEMEGQRCFPVLGEVRPPVRAALLFTAPAVTRRIVQECALAGVREVWMHRGAGQGAVDEQALAFCRERGMTVVAGECPFMFLPGTGLVHRCHRFVRRITGSLPAA